MPKTERLSFVSDSEYLATQSPAPNVNKPEDVKTHLHKSPSWAFSKENRLKNIKSPSPDPTAYFKDNNGYDFTKQSTVRQKFSKQL